MLLQMLYITSQWISIWQRAREILESAYSLKIPVDLKTEAEIHLGKDLCVCVSVLAVGERVSFFLLLGIIYKNK